MQAGQRIGRYVVLDELGAGGMGAVYKAYDPQLDRAVAIKLLHAEVDEEDTARLRREAQALAKLSHPNVVHVYEVGEIGGQTFLAMELVKGRTLRAWMEQMDDSGEPEQPGEPEQLEQMDEPEPRRGWRECVEVYVQAGAGLAAAHEVGLVHRDFKPDNAIIDDKGLVRVLDFGLARRAVGAAPGPADDRPADLSVREFALEASLTSPGTLVGTPHYMPPEQWQRLDVGPHGDQFSFCVALYEAVHGERPFEGTTIPTLMIATVTGRIRPAPKGRSVPATLRTVLLRGLAIDPADRWPSMEALLEQLRTLVVPPFRRYVRLGVGMALALAALASIVVARQSDELSEKDIQLTEKEALLAQQLMDLKEEQQRTKEQLAAQRGMGATMLAKDTGHELEAVALAVEAFDGLDGHTGPVSAPVFEGLASALTTVHRGIALRGHEGEVVAVAVSPDGQQVATASHDQTVRLWDAHSGKPRRTFEGHTGPVHAVAFSPDGTTLATAGEDKTARTWDATTGKELDALEHEGAVRSVAFSPDGQALATASGDAAWVWHLGADALVVPMLGHTGRVRSVAFSSDGTRLWTASEDQTVRVWDAQTGAARQTLEGHTDKVFGLAVSPDGTRIATGSRDQTARLWDAATGHALASFEHGEVVEAVAWSPDGTTLATGTFEDGAAHRWEVATGRKFGSVHHGGAVFDVTFSPDGHQLVTASWDFMARSWDLGPGGAIAPLPHPEGVDAVAVSPDGARIATGGRDGAVRLWDARSGAHTVTLEGHRTDVLSVAFSPAGSRIATASWDGTVRLWDVDSGIHRVTLRGHTGPVRAVAFSPDGTRVVTASRDGTARVWDATTGEELRSLSHEGARGLEGPEGSDDELHESPLVDVRFTPDGQRVLTVGADDTARVWDTATEGALSDDPYVALLNAGPVTAVAVSPDGQRLAAAAKDGSVRSWDLRSGEAWATARGHTAPVRKIAFSRDGTRLATASEDGTARVWDAATGDPRTAFVHEGTVTSVAFSTEGAGLVTASGLEGARRWSLEPKRWRAWGCAVLDGRQGHTAMTTRVCARDHGGATGPEHESTLEAAEAPEAVISTAPDVEVPETATVHGVELVLIPGGTFMMGSPEDEYGRYSDEGPPHEVTLEPFYLARTELTNAQYARYLEANPNASKPPLWEHVRYNQPQQPVVGLNWYEATAYCEWAGLVLPTEAQWEYAARAGTTAAYWFGDDGDDLERFGWFSTNSGGKAQGLARVRAHSVGTQGANPWGLFDVYGNVWEWTLDVYAPYTTSVRIGDGLRKEPVGDANRVLRGGGYGFDGYGGARLARSAFRLRFQPGNRLDDAGVRPAQGIH